MLIKLPKIFLNHFISNILYLIYFLNQIINIFMPILVILFVYFEHPKFYLYLQLIINKHMFYPVSLDS